MKKTVSYLVFFAIGNLLHISCAKKQNIQVEDESNSSSKPNIVFIIADDMGWDVFGKYPGANAIKPNTPTLDSLAKTGITFNNLWVHPECAPTRACLLTGKYGFRTGIGSVNSLTANPLLSSETIVQKYIKNQTNNAYATALIGKWHVSKNTDLSAPENFGIDYFAGILQGAIPDYYSWIQTSLGKQETITTYVTTQIVNQSITWVKNQTKPFFLWMAMIAPHTPFHRPPLNLISDKSLSNATSAINANSYNYYLASIEAMDKEIGRFISSMTTLQRQNTVFVFIGDNGTPTQVVQEPYKTNGGKSKLFQGGVNTPLIVSGVGVSRKNVTELALIQNADFFSTFAEITDNKTKSYNDGSSFKALFTDEKAIKRTYAYIEQFNSDIQANDGYAIRNNDYKYIKLDNNNKEYLYKISTDPFEKTNLLNTTLNAEAQLNLESLKKIKAGL